MSVQPDAPANELESELTVIVWLFACAGILSVCVLGLFLVAVLAR